MKKVIFTALAITATVGSLMVATGWADNDNAMNNANAMSNTDNRKLIDPNEQYALAMSRQPTVVGVEKLRQEAEGFRQLPPEALANIRAVRLQLE